MKTQQKKQNQKKSKQKTKSSPREEVIRWVKEFVEVPHPMFADYPPCPYAKQARLAGKVDFVDSALHTEIGRTTERNIRTQRFINNGRPSQAQGTGQGREHEPRSVHTVVGAEQN